MPAVAKALSTFERHALDAGIAVLTLLKQRGTLILSSHGGASVNWRGPTEVKTSVGVNFPAALADLAPPAASPGRRCRICERLLPPHCFTTSKASTGKLETRCRVCLARRGRIRRAKKHEARRARAYMVALDSSPRQE